MLTCFKKNGPQNVAPAERLDHVRYKRFLDSKILRQYTKGNTSDSHKSNSDQSSSLQASRKQMFVSHTDYSVNDILKVDRAFIESQVLEVISPKDLKITPEMLENRKFEDRKFVQIKKKAFNVNGKNKVLIQLVDISNNILYDQ